MSVEVKTPTLQQNASSDVTITYSSQLLSIPKEVAVSPGRKHQMISFVDRSSDERIHTSTRCSGFRMRALTRDARILVAKRA